MQINALEKEHSIWAKSSFDDDDIDTCKINRNGSATETQSKKIVLFIKWNGVNKIVPC